MNDIWIGIITLVAGGILTWISQRIVNVIRKNVRVSSPLETKVGVMALAVNMLLEIAGPQLGAIIALLEAAKGDCDGNVEYALEKMRTAQTDFDVFRTEAAKCEEAKS